MDPAQYPDVWAAPEAAALARLVDVVAPPGRDVLDHSPEVLADVEVVITGWGAQPLDGRLLQSMPRLSIVLHAAGSVRSLGTAEFWAGDVPVVSAVDQNTMPTAEFAAAQIIYALKKGWQSSLQLRRNRSWRGHPLPVPGLHGSVVGLVSFGRVARHVAQRLNAIGSLRVAAFDPYLPHYEIEALGVEPMSLEDLFARSDVVSLHTPWIPETTGLVTEELLRSLKTGATLINTSRGAIVDQDGLIRVLRDRPDLFAALDVTHPEPPEPESLLYDLDNVSLTPHIAGSVGNEKRALAQSILTQLEHFLSGLPIHPVSHDDLRSPAEIRPTAGV